jgi:protein-tyrosine phosphatase
MISTRQCTELLQSFSDVTLLLDVRPYFHFSKARIRGSLNLCIPTTLLKRPSFNLQKLEDTFFGDSERKRFTRWRLSNRIVVYDANTAHLQDAMSLVNVLQKFTGEGWTGKPLILRGGFTQFSAEFPDWVETHENCESAGASEQLLSISLALPATPSVAGGCSIPKSNVSVNPFFENIRQNMDLIGGVGQIPIKLPSAMTKATRKSLPLWLYRASDPQDNGKTVSEKFLDIEKSEQRRMQEALTSNVSYRSHASTASKETFRIAGIEKGSKNRYNNIYPYDHSRVRLQGVPNGSCDYVNASYIQASRSNKRYIATQAPIPATFNVGVYKSRIR